MNALELSGVSAGYGAREVLHDISFTLQEGERLAILGSNGSGKSTLLRAIAGLIPSRGKIKISGEEIKSMNRRQMAQKTALMSQFSGVQLPYTVRETVLLGRYAYRKRGLFSGFTPADAAVCRRCMEAAGLQGLEKQPVTALSGGQLQRVFLARALCQEPDVILLDEPTSHLDLKYQAGLSRFLEKWVSDGRRAVAGVMHDLPLAMQFADKVLFLKDGRTAAFGRLKETVSPVLLKEVYGMDVADYMFQALRRFEEVCHE